MLDPPPRPAADPALASALERAAGAIARLDQALATHPLRPAFLHRARLEAVRRQADVDGQAIDPWHLAAVLEGLRLRVDGAPRIIDRGAVFEAARHALRLHQWLASPDEAQQTEIARAAAQLAAAGAGTTSLLAAARGARAWLAQGGARPPLRAALVAHWARHRLLSAPVPLTGAAALRPRVPWALDLWIPCFLDALAGEAEDGLRLLGDMERAWFAARAAVAGRRRTSRAAAAVDLMAAAPLVSATSLAAGLGMAVKNAAQLLDAFCAEGVALEVTHRSKRRLFALPALAPLRAGVAPPCRPLPGRGRGRPRTVALEAAEVPPPPLLLPERPLSPLERRALDYADLGHAMALADQAIRRARRALDALLKSPQPEPAESAGQHDVAGSAGSAR
jgi:hypothetical protein